MLTVEITDNDLACHFWACEAFRHGLTQCLFPDDIAQLQKAVVFSHRVFSEGENAPLRNRLDGRFSSCSASTTATNSGSPDFSGFLG